MSNRTLPLGRSVENHAGLFLPQDARKKILLDNIPSVVG